MPLPAALCAYSPATATLSGGADHAPESRQTKAGLHILIHAAVSLVKDRTMIESDLFRLERALADLLASTKYEDVLFDSRRAVSISLVRRESVRMASALKQRMPDSGALTAWLDEGLTDPLSEVRFATLTI
jgi:hypothetical protein